MSQLLSEEDMQRLAEPTPGVLAITIEGVSFYRNCSAASAGDYNKVI